VELGLLPALGGGLGELARSGQVSRLVEGYLRPYSRAFDRVWYASYARETLGDYTDDPVLQRTVRVLAARDNAPRLARAAAIPLTHRRELSRCGVLRVFQVTGALPAIMARARWGIPFVTTYGFWYARLSRPGPSRLARRALERAALRRAAAVIVPTLELSAHVRTMTAPDRIHLIPNGVDLSRFRPRPPRGGRGGTVLYVGRLSAEKNLSALIGAAAMLGRRAASREARAGSLRLVIVGDGPLRPALEADARAAGVTAEFPGVVEHARIPEWMAAADVFALPSFTEGHPKVLIEAMAAGVPCLASDCAGNRALVKDGETGLLFDPHDPAALAAGLERILSDPAHAAALSANASAAVARDHDLARLVEAEIALLKRVARR